MIIDRAGFPFIGGAALCAGLAAVTVGTAGAVPLALLALFFAFFFRDPQRSSPADPHVVLAPADGRVLVAGPAHNDVAPPGTWQQISIFLSPMDVHVNRVPVTGRVTRVEFRRGRFLPAYSPAAAAANERSEIWLDHHGQTIVFRQIVGVLARRVVCRVGVGAQVRAGDRFGLMKFGSRMDVFLPPSAQLLVAVGDHVRGGETILARLI